MPVLAFLGFIVIIVLIVGTITENIIRANQGKINYRCLRKSKKLSWNIDKEKKYNGILRVTHYAMITQEYGYWHDFKLNFKNKSDKTIKYLELVVYIYNRVGDFVDIKKLTYIGPCRPKEYTKHFFKDSIKDETASMFNIDKITILYMDGSIELIEYDNLKYLGIGNY